MFAICTPSPEGHALAPATGSLQGPVGPLLQAWTDMAQVPLGNLQEVAEAVVGMTDEFDPIVRAEHSQDGEVRLTWEGSFTRGRQAILVVRGSHAMLTWDSGTGRSSWWLGRALAISGLVRFRRADVARLRGALAPETHGRLAALSC